MKVYITGTDGYVARNLFSRLYEKHVDASLISLRGSEWKNTVFSENGVVVHLAGAAHNNARDEDEFFRINAGLTGELAKKSKADGVGRFIFVSSMAVYGAENKFLEPNVIDAQTPPAPKTPYGASKLAGERVVSEVYGDSACIVRPPMVYGENCTGNYRLLRSIALKLRLVPRIDNTRSMIYVHNLCEFLCLLIGSNDCGVFHPQDANTVTTYRLAQEIGRLNGVRVRAAKLPFTRLAAKTLPPFAKAFGNLSYSPGLSAYGGDYHPYNAEQALERTEKLWR